MFGYVIPDKPNMFMKDYTLYRAFYCGICKSLSKHASQLMRFTTNYDITFINILYHAVCDVDVEISNEACILNPFKKRSIVKDDIYTQKILHFNTLLAHYKCLDDILDENSLSKKIIDKTILNKYVKKAKKEMPKVDEIISKGYQELNALEKANCDSLDKVCHPFANLMKQAIKEIFLDKYNDAIGEIIYALGKYVYLMDAIDDIDDDFKNNKFNVFLSNYKYTDKETFLLEKKELLEFNLMNCYNTIIKEFDAIKINKYEGVLTNILWYGILGNIKTILGRTQKCKKIRI